MKLRRKHATETAAPSIYESDRTAPTIGSTGRGLIEHARDIYRNNPKKIGGAALLGAVALLGLVKNRGLRRVS